MAFFLHRKPLFEATFSVKDISILIFLTIYLPIRYTSMQLKLLVSTPLFRSFTSVFTLDLILVQRSHFGMIYMIILSLYLALPIVGMAILILCARIAFMTSVA